MKKQHLIWITLLILVILGLLFWPRFFNLNNSSGVVQTSSTEVTESDWSRGNPEALVTLIEYSDFQCPACGAYHPVVAQLLVDFENDMRLVYRHYPLTQIHANALSAAFAAEAAGRQGKFWEMHDILFEQQEVWSSSATAKDIFVQQARDLDLDIERYINDTNDKELFDKVQNMFNEGARLGINSTPTFFLNGKLIQGPSSYEEFKEIVVNELARYAE